MANPRLEFRVLGPLVVEVDGAPVPIGGPKQRALLALLLLSANRVVARERLIAELFADQSVNSADHALRNHVSRLRKVLNDDSPRIAARAPGYLLRVEPGELDFEEFERLLAGGREALAAGDAAVAAAQLRGAESLWQGRALADLEFEPFARVDVERLEELRLAAVEHRIDAELALGRQRELVPELEALCSEHPYRERFRAQLMLALYRSGRQVEGLGVYRRARSLLREELGLEPGVELQQLERAILVQAPELILTRPAAPPSPRFDPAVCPYKGLAPFETADAGRFFGRERLVAELVGRLAGTTFVALVGASGSGKSSLLRAGLLPALADREHVVVRPGPHSAAELDRALETARNGTRLVVAVDQFEDLLRPSVEDRDRRAFVAALVDAAWDPDRRTAVIVALRADYLGRLAPYGELADLVAANHVLLGPLTATELQRAIVGPAESAGLSVETELVDTLVDDALHESGALSMLSAVLVDLWHDRDGSTLTRAGYGRIGGIRGAVARHAEAALASLHREERSGARRLLLRLVITGDDGTLMRHRATPAEVDADDPLVARALDVLVERRLVVVDGESVELVHDALLDQWPTLAVWLEEDADGRRLRRRVAEAAAEWDSAGRDDSELYRGARLAAAADWVEAAGPDAGLNRVERAFLEASVTAYNREEERQRRLNRRLRALLIAAVALLAAAAAAGAAALIERGTARAQATAAIAQRLGAQALVEPSLDRSLLLAREGVRVDDSAATRSNLLAALLRSPAALAVLHPSGTRVLDDALSPDGRILAVRGDAGTVDLFDTATLRELKPRLSVDGQLKYFGAIVRPVRAIAFSPDGRTLAVGDSDGHHATVALFDVQSHRRLARVVAFRAATADVVFAPNGRMFVTGEAVSGRFRDPAEVLVERRSSDAGAIRRSQPIPHGRLIGFVNGGRDLLVTSGDTRSLVLDARTFRRVRMFGRAGPGAVSPDGTVAAFGRDDGSVALVDLVSGRVRAMTRRAEGGVLGVAFDRDGKVLATTSDDGSVSVWDVPDRTLRETFLGHSAAALGPVFSRDGTTLYTGSGDGSVIAWDVRGLRRLGRPFRFAPVPAVGEGPDPELQNAAPAVAASPDGALFATSPGAGRVTLWRTHEDRVERGLAGPTGAIESLAFDHDGRLLAATGDGPETVVWDVRTRKIVLGLKRGGPLGSAAVAFSADDRLVATAGIDGRVRVYRVSTGEQVGGFSVHGSLQDLDFSPDGSRLAAAGLTGEIALWDPKSGRVERRLDHHVAILSLRFSPDGRTIATGDLAGAVDFWDASTGRPAAPPLAGQNGLVFSVSYSPDGSKLVTASSDGRLRLYDLETGKLIGAPLPGASAAGAAAFLPDGKHVLAAFADGTGVVWNLDPAAWEAQACRVSNRNLTRAEWHDFLPELGYSAVCS